MSEKIHDYWIPEATARVIESCMKRVAESPDDCELRITKRRINGTVSFDVVFEGADPNKLKE